MQRATKASSRHRLATAGFTLIEMLLVLAIAAMLMTAAVPAYQEQVQGGRMSAASRELLSNLTSAKAESVGRSQFVTVCTANSAGNDCVTSGDWSQGWITFTDADGDGDYESGDEIIQIHDPLYAALSARGTADIQSRITFRPNGQTHFSGTQTLVICDERGFGSDARALVISIVGKTSIVPADESGQNSCLSAP